VEELDDEVVVEDDEELQLTIAATISKKKDIKINPQDPVIIPIKNRTTPMKSKTAAVPLVPCSSFFTLFILSTLIYEFLSH